jgi:hypothetical protein
LVSSLLERRKQLEVEGELLIDDINERKPKSLVRKHDDDHDDDDHDDDKDDDDDDDEGW